jgi:hypothetical protein
VAVAVLAFLAVAFSQGVASASVSSTPAATPQLGTSGTDGTVEQIRQLTLCNNGVGNAPIMYAVGHFSQVKNGGSGNLIARNNAFAFSAVAPYKVTTWNPNVNGVVDTVACAPDGSLLLGGSFSAVGTTTTGIRNIARVDNVNGAVRPFAVSPVFNGHVMHIEVVQGHALVGGYFTAQAATATSPAAPGYLRSLNPVTGAADGYGLPAISGTYVYPGASANATRIYNMTVSPNGAAVLMTGVFTRVGGQHHQQVFRLNITPGAATVSPWSPTELYSYCSPVEPFYAQDAAWSPDMSTIYTADTGYRLYNQTNNALPRTGPCDAAIAYQATSQTEFSGHKWINYTGCDSLYSVAADSSTAFFGGHQRWVSNPNGCDKAGPGAVAQPGLAELSPANGARQPGPSRGRGLGADDLVRTASGLWVASDNAQNTSDCAGQFGHSGLCYLPN